MQRISRTFKFISLRSCELCINLCWNLSHSSFIFIFVIEVLRFLFLKNLMYFFSVHFTISWGSKLASRQEPPACYGLPFLDLFVFYPNFTSAQFRSFRIFFACGNRKLSTFWTGVQSGVDLHSSINKNTKFESSAKTHFLLV